MSFFSYVTLSSHLQIYQANADTMLGSPVLLSDAVLHLRLLIKKVGDQTEKSLPQIPKVKKGLKRAICGLYIPEDHAHSGLIHYTLISSQQKT